MATHEAAIRDWLKGLGMLCAGQMSVRDAQAKAAAYAPMLAHEFKREVFTPASLTAVARICKFFPSFGELCDALSAWWDVNRPYEPTVPLLTGPKPDIPKPRDPPTEAELAAISGITAALKANYGYHRSRPWPYREQPSSRPQVLSPERMLAAYERLAAAGYPAAAIRVAMLRRAITNTEGEPPP